MKNFWFESFLLGRCTVWTGKLRSDVSRDSNAFFFVQSKNCVGADEDTATFRSVREYYQSKQHNIPSDMKIQQNPCADFKSLFWFIERHSRLSAT